jgi:hypothetical protein
MTQSVFTYVQCAWEAVAVTSGMDSGEPGSPTGTRIPSTVAALCYRADVSFRNYGYVVSAQEYGPLTSVVIL